MNFLSRLLNRWLDRPAALKQPVKYKRRRYVEDLDEAQVLKENELVFVGTKDRPKWVVLSCPCGCGHILNVNLMRTHHPHWEVVVQPDGTVSLSPSLWVRDAKCRSHFFVHRGRVIWAAAGDDSFR